MIVVIVTSEDWVSIVRSASKPLRASSTAKLSNAGVTRKVLRRSSSSYTNENRPPPHTSSQISEPLHAGDGCHQLRRIDRFGQVDLAASSQRFDTIVDLA